MRERGRPVQKCEKISMDVIGVATKRYGLRGHGQVEYKDKDGWVKRWSKWMVKGTVPVGRLRRTWRNC